LQTFEHFNKINSDFKKDVLERMLFSSISVPDSVTPVAKILCNVGNLMVFLNITSSAAPATNTYELEFPCPKRLEFLSHFSTHPAQTLQHHSAQGSIYPSKVKV
jgi:hypothetical protein